MKISELIKKLNKLQEEKGNLEVRFARDKEWDLSPVKEIFIDKVYNENNSLIEVAVIYD